jgi:hypothetical protein
VNGSLRGELEDLVNRWAVGGNGIDASSRDLISACSAELLRVLDEHPEAPGGEDDGATVAAPDPEPFSGYALVELMGHAQVTGSWRETTLCGRPMLEITRLDVAERRVQLVGPESVYRFTPLTEAEAMHVTRYARAALAAPTSVQDIEDDIASWDDDDTDPDEGKDDGMSQSERDEYDRDAEFCLDAADEARDLEREAEAGL